MVTEALAASGVPYMMTGSLAGSYHGAPRATQDVDLVVDAPLGRLLDVGERLRSRGMYVSDDAIHEAVSTEGMFNAVDPDSGWKIDFIICKAREFSRAEFEAREEIDFMGLRLSLASAEDVVVAKLEWAKLGGSQQQLRDVADILAVQGESLDESRIERWVEALGLGQQWDDAQALSDREGESL